jgi:crotonobetainyl-CoA:carnitine CoA-transferase CaiB-like acyl-CoA transferase
MSILTAYYHKLVTGEGQHIDVSQHAAANVTTEMASYHWLVQQGTVQRQTGRHAMETPSLPVQTRCMDGRYVTTGIPPRSGAEFGAVYEWLERLGLVDEFPEAIFLKMGAEREFIDLSTIGTDDETTAIFGAGREALALIATRVSAYDYFIGAQEIGMTVGVVYAPEEVMEDPHFEARGFPTEVEHEELGRQVRYPGAPYRFEKSPWRISRRAPRLGEHTDEVLGSVGIGAAEVAALREARVI